MIHLYVWPVLLGVTLQGNTGVDRTKERGWNITVRLWLKTLRSYTPRVGRFKVQLQDTMSLLYVNTIMSISIYKT